VLELARFTEDDCDRLIGWIPDARALMLWAGPAYNWPLDSGQLVANLERGGGYRPVFFLFKAVEMETGRVVGHIELQRYERRAGHVARVLIGDPGCRGRGYGKELVSLLVRFAFVDLDFKLLSLNVYDFNTPAVECYKSIGFRQTEFQAGAREFQGELWNLLTMELRRDEWRMLNGIADPR
jgi:RimJ/RimL family protein N-acetyltransferase